MLAFVWRCMTRQIPPLMSFSTINSMSMSVSNSNSTSAFSDIPPMLILVSTKSMIDQACIFQCTCCRSFRIHQCITFCASLLSNSSALLCTYRSWYYPRFCIPKFFQTQFARLLWASNVFTVRLLLNDLSSNDVSLNLCKLSMYS